MDAEAIWSRGQDYINIISIPLTEMITYTIYSKKVKWFLRKTSLNFDMKMALGQSQEMTLTLDTHILLSTHLAVCVYLCSDYTLH